MGDRAFAELNTVEPCGMLDFVRVSWVAGLWSVYRRASKQFWRPGQHKQLFRLASLVIVLLLCSLVGMDA